MPSENTGSALNSQWWNFVSKRPLTTALVLALLFRLGVFFGSMIWPIFNENQMPVSPLHEQGYLDFSFYVKALMEYRSSSFSDLFDKFVAFYQRPFQEQFGHIIAGPVFPLIIGVFDYRQGNTLPLAATFLLLDYLWSGLWLRKMAGQGLGVAWMTLFAFAPNPVWFMLVLSPDLIFAALVGFFYFAYFNEQQTRRTAVTWVVFLVLILLTRPNGYSILLFVIADFAWRQVRQRNAINMALPALGILALLFALYLYPYFITEMRKAATGHTFFGLTSAAYANGLFDALPYWLNLTVSWVTLLGAKTLYFVGLRPAYGEASEFLVVARALPGLILLPGLFWGLILAGRRHALFLALFCLPILLGPAQDRYNLPIYPMLFMFGALAYHRLWHKIRS